MVGEFNDGYGEKTFVRNMRQSAGEDLPKFRRTFRKRPCVYPELDISSDQYDIAIVEPQVGVAYSGFDWTRR